MEYKDVLERVMWSHNSLCTEARDLLVQKNADYAGESTKDFFKNFRKRGAVGIFIRLDDKLARLESFEQNKSFAVKDESVRDTVKDAINYLVLLYEWWKQEELDASRD